MDLLKPAAAGLLGLALGLSAGCSAAQPDSVPASLQQQLPELMQRYHVPAVAIATIRDGQLGWIHLEGERATDEPLDTNSVFNVASLTKPLFGMLALRLVAEGELDLDQSLSEHWIDPDVAEDPRREQLTPRLLLSHQGGFANWRGNRPLGFAFSPGERHEYSGEGFEYLRRAIERKSGDALPALMQTHVLEPGGFDIQFGWSDELAARIVGGFDEQGRPVDMNLAQRRPNAAANSFASVEDYARFVAWVVRGAGLPQPLIEAMRTPQAVHADPAERFGLGWKLSPDAEDMTLWHDGRENGLRTLAIARPQRGDGLVLLSNGANGELLRRFIVRTALEDGDAWLAQADRDVWRYLQTVPDAHLGGLMQMITRSPSYMATLLHAVNTALVQPALGEPSLRAEAEPAIDAWIAAMLAGRIPAERTEAALGLLLVHAAEGQPPSLVDHFDATQAQTWLRALRTDDLPESTNVAKAQQRPVVSLPAALLAEYAGHYRVPSSELLIRIEAAEGMLIAHAANTPSTQFHPASERVFFMRESETDFEFERGESGEVRGITIRWGNGRSEFAPRVTGDQSGTPGRTKPSSP